MVSFLHPMKLGSFNTSRDGFNLLHLRAHFHFKTASSIGFRLGPVPKIPRACIIFGAAQIHHPCEGCIRAQIQLQLPQRYKDGRLLRQFREAFFGELGIAEDETWELSFSEAAHVVGMSQRISRDHLVDAL